MCQLKIENIGAIKNINLNVKRFTMVIGPESSGKSTIAKLLCHCEWVEKRCYNNSDEISQMEANFLTDIVNFHRMDNYFSRDSYLNYVGTYLSITLKNKKVNIEINSENEEYYNYPKVCYIPSERNFAATIPNLNKYNESNDNIMYFLYDWDTARKFVKDVDLHKILNNNIMYKYDVELKEDIVYDGETPLKLRNASSGVQSVVPLFTTIEYELSGVYDRIHPLSLEQKEQAESVMNKFKQLFASIKSKDKTKINTARKNLQILMNRIDNDPVVALVFNDTDAFSDILSRNENSFYRCSNLFIEEPEQNIFPDTQERLLYWLLSNVLNGDRLHTAFVTTHSPYLLFALNNCLIGNIVKEKLPESLKDNMQSVNAWADKELIAVYELHNGELKSIQEEDGLLTDNYLNKAYKQISNEYLKMLTYYD